MKKQIAVLLVTSLVAFNVFASDTDNHALDCNTEDACVTDNAVVNDKFVLVKDKEGNSELVHSDNIRYNFADTTLSHDTVGEFYVKKDGKEFTLYTDNKPID